MIVQEGTIILYSYYVAELLQARSTRFMLVDEPNRERHMHEGRAQVLQAELDRFVDIVSRDMNPERIVLFGSFAHGEVHEWSDLDLVVVMETDLSFLNRLRTIRRRVHPQVTTDLFVYTPDEWERLRVASPFIRDEIDAKGRVLSGHVTVDTINDRTTTR